MKKLNNSLRNFKSTSSEKDIQNLRDNIEGLTNLIGNYLKTRMGKIERIKSNNNQTKGGQICLQPMKLNLVPSNI